MAEKANQNGAVATTTTAVTHSNNKLGPSVLRPNLATTFFKSNNNETAASKLKKNIPASANLTATPTQNGAATNNTSSTDYAVTVGKAGVYPQQTKSSTQGKSASTKRAMPMPVSLPSLRKTCNGNDPNVKIVPEAGGGKVWGSSGLRTRNGPSLSEKPKDVPESDNRKSSVESGKDDDKKEADEISQKPNYKDFRDALKPYTPQELAGKAKEAVSEGNIKRDSKTGIPQSNTWADMTAGEVDYDQKVYFSDEENTRHDSHDQAYDHHDQYNNQENYHNHSYRSSNYGGYKNNDRSNDNRSYDRYDNYDRHVRGGYSSSRGRNEPYRGRGNYQNGYGNSRGYNNYYRGYDQGENYDNRYQRNYNNRQNYNTGRGGHHNSYDDRYQNYKTQEPRRDSQYLKKSSQEEEDASVKQPEPWQPKGPISLARRSTSSSFSEDVRDPVKQVRNKSGENQPTPIIEEPENCIKGPAALPPPRDPNKTKKVGLLGDAPEPYRPPPKVTKPSRSDVPQWRQAPTSSNEKQQQQPTIPAQKKASPVASNGSHKQDQQPTLPKQEEQPKEPSPITSSAYTIPESTRGVWNNTQKETKVDWLQQNSRPASSNLSWSQPTSSSFNTFQQAPHTQNPLASTIFSQPPQQPTQPVINQQRSIFDMQNQQMHQLQQEHIMKQQLLQAQMMQQGISQQQMTNLMNNLNLSKDANIFGSNFGVIGQHQIQQVSLQQQRQAQFLQMQQIQQMQQRQMIQQQQMNRITPTTSHFDGYKNLQTPQSLMSNSNHRLDMISHSPSLQKWPVISNLENDPDRASLQTPSDNAPNHSKQPSNVSNHSDKRRSKSRKTTPPANLSGWGEIPEFENQTDHKLGTSYWGNEEPAPQALNVNKPTKNIENDAKKVLSGSLNWLENSNKSETTEKPPVINVWQQNLERRAKELEENAKKSQEGKSDYRPEKRFERRGRYVDREKIEIKPERKRDDRRDREKRFDKNRGDRKKRDDRRRDENRDNRKKNHSGRQKESDKPKIIKSEGWGDVDGTQEQPASNWMKEVQKLPNSPVTTGKSKPIEINAKKWDDVKVEKKRVRSGKDNRDTDEKKISSDKFSDKNYDVYEPEKPEKGRSRFRSGDKNIRRDRNFGARNDDKPRRGGFRRNRDSNQKDQQRDDRSQRGSENTKNFKNIKSSFHSRKNDERRDDNRDQLPEKKKADQRATKKPPQSQTLRDVANNNKQATTSLL